MRCVIFLCLVVSCIAYFLRAVGDSARESVVSYDCAECSMQAIKQSDCGSHSVFVAVRVFRKVVRVSQSVFVGGNDACADILWPL